MIQTWSIHIYEFIMLIWIKNYEVWLQIDHNWLFPNTVDFRSTDQLIEQKCDPNLETWHEKSWGSKMIHESHIRHYKFNYLCTNSNPNFELSVFEEVSWADQTLCSLESMEILWEISWEMRGKILGYNSCPCSIFLNLKS